MNSFLLTMPSWLASTMVIWKWRRRSSLRESCACAGRANDAATTKRGTRARRGVAKAVMVFP